VRLLPRPQPLRALDERIGFAGVARKALGKVFPDHWSFMLGEIALYSFMILIATGVYLTLFFEPSTALRPYTGDYDPLSGELLSGAYASTIELSFDVPGGLLMRQAHHWAAHIFIGAITLHLCRMFFTAMFRRPRELNWMVGLTLLILSIFNAYAGYSLPDDLLSGTGLRIFEAILRATPLVGAWLSFLMFGGEFPGDAIIERLYILHVLVVPGLLAAGIAVHLLILVVQKHSHFAGPGRRETNVVGSRVWPAYALRSLSLLSAVAAVCFLAGGLLQINPIWAWGGFEPATITSPSVADWYILWIEGALRLFPPIEFTVFGLLVPNQFWAGVFLPAMVFGVLYLWPWIDRRLTGDRGTHHITGRPREAPARVGIGAWAITFMAVLLAAGAQETWVQWTDWDIATVRTILRITVLALPVLVGVVSWWLARSLKHQGEERELLELQRTDLAPAAHHDQEEVAG
jgi:ubiquinol-cytochrome c reductase cytochrome b subunit